jgi:hypothetical protein
MRENRPSGSEGGATLIPSSLPLSIISSLRDKDTGVLMLTHMGSRRNAALYRPFDTVDACSRRASRQDRRPSARR